MRFLFKGGFWRALALILVLGFFGLTALLYFQDRETFKRGVRALMAAISARSEDPEVRYVEREKEIEVFRDRIVEREKVVKVYPDLPSTHGDPVHYDPKKLYSGIQIRTEVQAEEGRQASLERQTDEAYELQFQVKVTLPDPELSLSDFAKLNPHLLSGLPGLQVMVPEAEVSGFFYQLYENKVNRVQSKLYQLDRILTRHNFFDCETMLELTHPETGRKALLIQADMDVVSDGSDGDRMPEMPDKIVNSSYYQPFTSYGWAKRGETVNPLIAPRRKWLKEAEEEYKIVGLPAARNRYLEARIARMKREIADLEARSFLIAEADPFIVVPLYFFRYVGQVAHAPMVGDYAVVIHEDRFLPAIVGDAGPTFKAGEASLRMAKELDPRSNPYRRPVSDLSVSYLVFPGTKKKPHGPPDYQEWRSRCQELLDDMGGLAEGYALHSWDNILPEPEPVEEAPPAEETTGQEAAAAEESTPTVVTP
ncbi:MAG: glycoside hydrolase family 75 protein [Verrucomicrobiota bacterium]